MRREVGPDEDGVADDRNDSEGQVAKARQRVPYGHVSYMHSRWGCPLSRLVREADDCDAGAISDSNATTSPWGDGTDAAAEPEHAEPRHAPEPQPTEPANEDADDGLEATPRRAVAR